MNESMIKKTSGDCAALFACLLVLAINLQTPAFAGNRDKHCEVVYHGYIYFPNLAKNLPAHIQTIQNSSVEPIDWAHLNDRDLAAMQFAVFVVANRDSWLSDPVVTGWLSPATLKTVMSIDRTSKHFKSLHEQAFSAVPAHIGFHKVLEEMRKLKVIDQEYLDSLFSGASQAHKPTADVPMQAGVADPKSMPDSYRLKPAISRKTAILDHLKTKATYMFSVGGLWVNDKDAIGLRIENADVASLFTKLGFNGGEPVTPEYAVATKLSELLGIKVRFLPHTGFVFEGRQSLDLLSDMGVKFSGFEAYGKDSTSHAE